MFICSFPEVMVPLYRWKTMENPQFFHENQLGLPTQTRAVPSAEALAAWEIFGGVA